jgi:hypothetical protein
VLPLGSETADYYELAGLSDRFVEWIFHQFLGTAAGRGKASTAFGDPKAGVVMAQGVGLRTPTCQKCEAVPGRARIQGS